MARDFDIHVYYTPAIRPMAESLREQALRDFTGQDVFISRMVDQKVLKYQLSELGKSEKDTKAEKIRLLEMLLEATFKGDHWSEHLSDLCDVDVTACKPYVSRIQDRLSYLGKQTGLFEAEKESQLADEYYYITQIYQALEDKPALREFAKQCAEHFEAMGKGSQLKISRAGSQGLMACFELSGDFAREEKAVDALIQEYPSEPTFLVRKARMLRKEKMPEAALELLNKAEPLAFGYNWYSLQLMKAEVLLDLKKPEQTRQVVETTLAQVRLDSSQDSRNQRLVQGLRGLQSRASE